MSTTTLSTNTAQPLTETSYSNTLRVDREAGVIRGVKIIGRESKNGRYYSDVALEQAAALYEGVGVNIDHPQHSTPEADRKLADGFGHLQNVARRHDGVFGDLVYLRTHALAEQVCEAAERMPRQLGLSHNAEGFVIHRNGRWIVEGIARVRSVDLVRNPATNRGLFESEGKFMADKVDQQAGDEQQDQPPKETDEAAVRRELLAILAAEQADDAEKVRRIKEFLATGKVETPESTRPLGRIGQLLTQLQESVARLERRDVARDLLDETGVVPDPTLLRSLSALEREEDMRTLIEACCGPQQFTDRGHHSWRRPRFEQPRSQQPLRESNGRRSSTLNLNDNKSLVTFLRS